MDPLVDERFIADDAAIFIHSINSKWIMVMRKVCVLVLALLIEDTKKVSKLRGY